MKTSLFVEVDFREVKLGSQKEILKVCIESKYVDEYDIVADGNGDGKTGLAVGDIVVDDTVCIERKSPSDFINSFTSGHLEEQIADMYNEYDHAHVLISGSMTELFRTRSNVNRNAITAFVSSMSVRWQMTPLFCDTERQLAKTAIDLGRKAHEPLNRKPGSPDIDVDHELDTVGKAVMLTDGIGADTAKKIQSSDKFMLVRDLCSASVEDFKKIDGIGQKTAKKLKHNFK
jgi:ERCC4-type nuclease